MKYNKYKVLIQNENTVKEKMFGFNFCCQIIFLFYILKAQITIALSNRQEYDVTMATTHDKYTIISVVI